MVGTARRVQRDTRLHRAARAGRMVGRDATAGDVEGRVGVHDWRRHTTDPEACDRTRTHRQRGAGAVTAQASLRTVVVAGVGMTAFGKFLNRNLKSLVGESVQAA